MCIVFSVLGTSVYAQRNVRDSTLSYFIVGVHGGAHVPFMDLQERFGFGGLVGAKISYKTKKNWTLGVYSSFLFGNRVKEDTILKPLLTRQGDLINRDGEFADVFISQRGMLIGGEIGKIIRVGKANANSGLHLAVGAGFMQHKIFINQASERVPQLVGEYKKGYDRLTNGFMLSQSIGYSFFSNYRLVNFYVGLEIYEGFTQNRRTLNYDTGLRDNRQRLDIMSSVVLRWYFPVYKRQAKEFYFY
ncbi:MAG: hypothetical protein Salg2KO_08150 [Salibacteraceae bacterium]